jgi:NADH-quinone oxidoreductase subunit A
MIPDYLRSYGVLAIFIGLAIAVPLGMLALSWGATKLKVRPVRPSPIKLSAYESGSPPLSKRPALFNIRYYQYALLFVVFDVETVFLYPWAVRYGVMSREFGLIALGAVLVFLGVLTVPYVYAWRKKAFEWQ